MNHTWAFMEKQFSNSFSIYFSAPFGTEPTNEASEETKLALTRSCMQGAGKQCQFFQINPNLTKSPSIFKRFVKSEISRCRRPHYTDSINSYLKK